MWVYKLLCKGETVYIGATTSERYKVRLYDVKSAARLGNTRPITSLIRKEGEHHFSIEPVEKCSTLEQLSRSEQYWISYYKSQGYDLQNVTRGGEGLAKVGSIHTKEQKLKWSEQRKGTITGALNPNWGKTGELSHKYGREVSQETREKARQGKLGERNPNFGKKYTDAERLARSLETKGIPRPKSARSAHTRWHTNKGVHKPDSCKYCLEDMYSVTE